MKSLKHKKTIDKIFTEGKKSYKKGSYKLVISELDSDIKGVVICVSSKKFRRAVDRNLIKRYVREGLRGKTANNAIAIIYNSDNLPDKKLIEEISKLTF